MSIELTDSIANSEYMLEHSLPHLEAGRLSTLSHLLGFAVLYRRRGIARMLVQGLPDPVFVAQMQAVSAFLHALPRVPEPERVLSLAACLWDAIAGQYWDAATELARLYPTHHNPKREHEDDFLYVAFLLQRYLLAPPADAEPERLEEHAAAELARLERWEEVLEGGLDPRLELCRALHEGDAGAFAEAIVSVSDARDEELLQRHEDGVVTKEDLAWLRPVWPEGLALLRLAERDGLELGPLQVPRVPPLLRIDNPYAYYPDAWRSIDFRPARRS